MKKMTNDMLVDYNYNELIQLKKIINNYIVERLETYKK